MGDKVTVDDLTTLDNSSAVPTINDNFDIVADEFDEVVYRDGSQTMQGDLDMDSNRIINLPRATNDTEPVTKGQIEDYAALAVGEGVADIYEHIQELEALSVAAAIDAQAAQVDAANQAIAAGISAASAEEDAADVAAANGFNVSIARATKAALDLLTGPYDEGTSAAVWNDPTEALNGIYSWTAGVWVKEADLPAMTVEALVEQAEDARDVAIAAASTAILGRTRFGESVRTPRENGESANGVNGVVRITNTVSILADWPLLGSDGCIAFTTRVPVLQYNKLRRRATMVGMGTSQTAARQFACFWQGHDSLNNPTGFADDQNRILFTMRDTASVDTILGSAVFPPEDSATQTTTVDSFATWTYNNPFPPSFNDNGDWAGTALVVIGRTGTTVQMRVWDCDTLTTYHGPTATYAGAGLLSSPAPSQNIHVGGSDTAPAGSFPSTLGDSASQTITYFRGEIGNVMVVNRHTTDAEWLQFLDGEDPATTFGANLRFRAKFLATDGTLETTPFFAGGGTAPALVYLGDIQPGSDHRPRSSVKWVKPRPLKDPCILPILPSANCSWLHVQVQTKGISDGKPLRVKAVLSDDTVVVDYAQVGKVATNVASGYLSLPPTEAALYLLYECDGVTWRENSPIYTCLVGLLLAQSQGNYATDIGAAIGNSGTEGSDSNAGTPAIPAVWTSDVGSRFFVISRNNPSVEIKPGILIGQYSPKIMAARRVALAEHLGKYTRLPICIIEEVTSGTGIRQLFSDNQTILNTDPSSVGVWSAYERMWSNFERELGCLGSVTQKGLYGVTAACHYWGSAENTTDYGQVLEAFFFGVPSNTGFQITQDMLDDHYIGNGKTIDPDFTPCLLPFNRATGSPLTTSGDSSAAVTKSESQREWGAANNVIVGPPINVHYLQTWNTTQTNPPAGVTHSQIDYQLGAILTSKALAETFANAFGLGTYKGRAYHDFANARFEDSSREAILVPVIGPAHGQALNRLDKLSSDDWRDLDLWGYEASEGNDTSYTPAKLIAKIHQAKTIRITKSDETAFNSITYLRYGSGAPGGYNFGAMQTQWIDDVGGQHARGLEFKEENFVAQQPTWNGWQIDGSNTGAAVLAAS